MSDTEQFDGHEDSERIEGVLADQSQSDNLSGEARSSAPGTEDDEEPSERAQQSPESISDENGEASDLLPSESPVDASPGGPAETVTAGGPTDGPNKKLSFSTIAKIALAVVGVVVVASVLIYFFVHDWREATCTEPQTCSICGITQGEPLGHDWLDATCTEPETCSVCGVTQGESLGHEWSDATCTEPKTCSRCGETEGSPLGHEWGERKVEKKATCTEEGSRQRTCEKCGEVEQESVPVVDHTPGDWETVEKPSLDSNGSPVPGKRVRKCTVCGKEVKSEEINLSDDEIESLYKKSCSSPSFDEVARNPDDYEGDRVKFTGEVIQVMQDGDTYTLRVNVTPVSYGYTDTIMVAYTAPEGASRILEDDVLTFYGLMGGMYTYESIFGASITVPLLIAQYAD